MRKNFCLRGVFWPGEGTGPALLKGAPQVWAPARLDRGNLAKKGPQRLEVPV